MTSDPEVVSPGVLLVEALVERDMHLSEFAERMGRSMEDTADLFAPTNRLTPAIAKDLARALDMSADYWLRHELQYREYLRRLDEDSRDQGERG